MFNFLERFFAYFSDDRKLSTFDQEEVDIYQAGQKVIKAQKIRQAIIEDQAAKLIPERKKRTPIKAERSENLDNPFGVPDIHDI